MLREFRSAGCPQPATAPVVIGIDDWALARRHRYGTIVVDLHWRCPIELLAERNVSAVVSWLQGQPQLEVIARDRASAYAEAAQTAAPDAQQVADRWHLLANVRIAIERMLLRCTPQMKEAARQASEALRPETEPAEVLCKAQDTVAAEPSAARQFYSAQRRASRLARYEKVFRRHHAGESILAIGLAVNLDRRTVRGFVRAGVFPERALRRAVPTLLDAHRQYMAARAAKGCRNAMQVWRELRERGFTGGHSIVRDAFAQLRGAQPDDGRLHAGPTIKPTVAVPSMRRAGAWVLGWHERKLEQTERSARQRFVETLFRIEPRISAACSLAHQFLDLMRRRNLDGFDSWLL